MRIHLWCPDDLPRLWDRIDRTVFLNMKFTGTYNRLNNYLLCFTLIGREQLISKGRLGLGMVGQDTFPRSHPPSQPSTSLPPATILRLPSFVQLMTRRNTTLTHLPPDMSSMQRRYPFVLIGGFLGGMNQPRYLFLYQSITRHFSFQLLTDS